MRVPRLTRRWRHSGSSAPKENGIGSTERPPDFFPGTS